MINKTNGDSTESTFKESIFKRNIYKLGKNVNNIIIIVLTLILIFLSIKLYVNKSITREYGFFGIVSDEKYRSNFLGRLKIACSSYTVKKPESKSSSNDPVGEADLKDNSLKKAIILDYKKSN